MKTLFNQLRLGTLLTGFIFLSSYTGDANTDTYASNSSRIKASPVQTVTGNDIHKANHSALPISFGFSEATLVDN